MDSWHKIPFISKIMCSLRRYDYEFVSANGNHGILECFYCLQRKGSTNSSCHF